MVTLFCAFKSSDKWIWHKYNKTWQAACGKVFLKKIKETFKTAGLFTLIKWYLVNADGRKNYGISQPTKYILNTYLNSSVLHTEYHPCCWYRLTYFISSKKQTLLLKHLLFRQINWSCCNWIARTQTVRSGIIKWTQGLSPDHKLFSTVTVPIWEPGRWQFPRSTSIFYSPKNRSMQGRHTENHLPSPAARSGRARKEPSSQVKMWQRQDSRNAAAICPLTVFTNGLW